MSPKLTGVLKEAYKNVFPEEATSKPIYAFRSWRMDVKHVLLKSVSHNVSWHGPVMQTDRYPHHFGVHGIWAVKPGHEGIALKYQGDVHGVLELQGTVTEHEYGYRAERVIIRCLYVELGIRTLMDFGSRAHSSTVAVEADSMVGLLEDRYHCEVTADPQLFYSSLPALYQGGSLGHR